MAVDIVVETGNVIANANSYVDLAFARAYAGQYGLSLPADDDAASSALLNAERFLAGFESRFQGRRVDADQVLSWPRAGVVANGFPVDTDAIPIQVKHAQVEAAALITSGALTFNVRTGAFVTKKKVDVIETEYSEKVLTTPDGNPQYPKIETLLSGFLVSTNGGYRLPGHGF